MTRFVDVYPPAEMPGWPCVSAPRWSTSIVTVDSGAEQVNQRWEHPLHSYTLPEAVRSHEVYEAVRDHWLAMRGPAHTWPFRDPLDFASRPLPAPNIAPAVTGADQVVGSGDGVTTQFQLLKSYTRGGQSYARPIRLPVVGSVVVTVNGQDPGALPSPLSWTVSRPGGVLTFSAPPIVGQIVRAGFLFDVEVRFEADDTFDGIARTYGVSGFASVPLVEVRGC